MHRDRRQERKGPKRALGMALLVGGGIVWPLPLAGALPMVAAGFGLAILWVTELHELVVTPVLIEPAVRRPEG